MHLNITDTTGKKLEHALGISDERTNSLCFMITGIVSDSLIKSQLFLRPLQLSDLYRDVAEICDNTEELVFSIDMTTRMLVQIYSQVPGGNPN